MVPGILFQSASSVWLIHYYIHTENTHYLFGFSSVHLKQSQLFGLYLEWRGATQIPPQHSWSVWNLASLALLAIIPNLAETQKYMAARLTLKAECLQVVCWSQFICELICSRLTKSTRCHKVSLGCCYQKNKTNPRIQSKTHNEGELELNIIRIISLLISGRLLFGLKLSIAATASITQGEEVKSCTEQAVCSEDSKKCSPASLLACAMIPRKPRVFCPHILTWCIKQSSPRGASHDLTHERAALRSKADPEWTLCICVRLLSVIQTAFRSMCALRADRFGADSSHVHTQTHTHMWSQSGWQGWWMRRCHFIPL